MSNKRSGYASVQVTRETYIMLSDIRAEMIRDLRIPVSMPMVVRHLVESYRCYHDERPCWRDAAHER